MSSSTSSFDDSTISDEVSNTIVRQTLNPFAPLFVPKNRFLPHYYFSPPPFYFIPSTSIPTPPSIFVYHPLWYINPNPNWVESTRDLPPLHSRNPSQELSLPPTSTKRVLGWRRSSGRKKVMPRRKIQYQAESNGNYMTTVMLRNIPNRYTREMMIEFLDEHCEAENKKEEDEEIPISAYDFLYLPIDFQRNMNKGYAFVNFTRAEAVSKFKAACNNKPWCHFSSRKILQIAYARIQGKDKLVKHFTEMTYPAEEYSAVSFNPARSGSKTTVETVMVGNCTEAMISA